MAKLEDCIEYLFSNEGGYSDLGPDKGGPTKFGITQTDLSQYLKRPCSADDIKNLDRPTATRIYEEFYWIPMDLNSINSTEKATAIFDIGVNCGSHTAIRYAQFSCNGHGALIEVDGYMGPITLNAINSIGISDFILAFYEEVVEGYNDIVKRNPSQEIFLKGWLNRAERLKSLIDLANEQSGLH